MFDFVAHWTQDIVPIWSGLFLTLHYFSQFITTNFILIKMSVFLYIIDENSILGRYRRVNYK